MEEVTWVFELDLEWGGFEHAESGEGEAKCTESRSPGNGKLKDIP